MDKPKDDKPEDEPLTPEEQEQLERLKEAHQRGKEFFKRLREKGEGKGN